jgi:hypothetical protein
MPRPLSAEARLITINKVYGKQEKVREWQAKLPQTEAARE